MRGFYFSATAALLCSAVIVPSALAQSQPGAPAGQDRCERLREAIAKHPAANPEAQARREKRLADCEAGKGSASDEGDQTATGSQPQPAGAQTGQSGGSDQGSQSASGGQPGVPPGGTGQAGSGGGDNSIPAPVSMAVPTLAPVAGAARAAPSALGRAVMPGQMSGIVNASPLITTLDVTVITGDDDLRANSAAWLDIQTPDGFVSKPCYIKNSPPAWDEHSTREAQCTLSQPMPIDQLRTARLFLEYDGSPNAYANMDTVDPYQTFDNWKVNSIHVTAMAPGQTPQCLVDAKGSPQLVELKGDNRKFQLGGGC